MTVPNGYDVFTLEQGGVADVAFSPDQTLLYAAMKNGDVEVFDIATHQKVATWHVGTSLGGISVSPDGTTLLVVEKQPAAGTATLYQVDIATGHADAYTRTVAVSGNAAFNDVEIVDSHTALLTGGGQNANILFSLDTKAFTTLAGGVYASNAGSALAEDQHLTLISEPGNSRGPLYLYDDRTNTIIASGTNYGNGISGENYGHNAISEAAGLVVQSGAYGSTVNVFDLNLHIIRSLSLSQDPSAGPIMGMAFDPTGSYLYAYMTGGGVIEKVDVHNWSVVAQYPFYYSGFSTGSYNDQLLVAAGGTVITVLDPYSGTLRLDILSPAYAVGATPGDDTIAGGMFVDALSGGDGNDTLYGRDHNDTLDGGNGQDSLYGENGDDLLIGGAGADFLVGDAGNDLLFSNLRTLGAGSAYQTGGLSTDTGVDHDILQGGAGDDVLYAGYGDDVDGGTQDFIGDSLKISFMGATSGITADFRLLATQASISFGGGTITGVETVYSIEGTNYDDFLVPWSSSSSHPGGYAVVFGRGGDDHIIAATYTDSLYGGDGNDILDASTAAYSPSLFGEAGNDTLIGGSGFGTYLYGGTGNDTYFVTSSSDVVTENANEGTDEVRTSLASYTLGANVENLTGLATTGQTLTGNGLDNRVLGNSGADTLSGGGGNDVLDGGAGADTMSGGTGNDIYYVDNASDIVSENPGEGTDEVRTSLSSYVLAANVENLTGVGTGQTLTGNGLDNVIAGAGSVVLSGGGGNDTLKVVNPVSAQLSGGTGTDTLVADLSGATGDVTTASGLNGPPPGTPDGYHFHYSGGGVSVDADGIENFDITTGAGNDYIVMGDGDDRVSLGAGDDYVRAAAGAIVADGGAGIDGISLDFSSSTANIYVNLQTDTLTGVPGSSIKGFEYFGYYGPFPGFASGSGDDIVIAGTGAQTNDIETNGGNDTITLFNGYANVYAGTGFDTLILDWQDSTTSVTTTSIQNDPSGDTYYTLSDSGGRGVLAASVEKLVITTGSGDDNFTTTEGDDVIGGGAGNDVIHALAGNDVIDGGTGADTMYGGTGNDIYYVDDAGDVVTENPNEGTDEVRSSIPAYTLPANVENLTYIGAGSATLRGNSLDNVITGGANADRIDLSDGGHDHAIGGGGYDVFVFGGAYDSGDVVEGGAGIDEVRIQGAYGTITLGANLIGVESVGFYGHASQAEGNPGASPYNYNVVIGAVTSDENMFYVGAALAANETFTVDASGASMRVGLTGSDGNDVLKGSVYDDWIYGGLGADTMTGGAGSDVYTVDNVNDVIVEKAGEGEDTVSVSLATYTLPDNLEDIIGFNIDQHLTGNAANNTIYSGSGNDVIDGGAGADRMGGSAGDDIYYADNVGDAVIENPGEGTDEVRTSLASYTLPGNVENITGLASSGQTLTGNGLDNRIVSSDGPDHISGGDGNDTIAFSSVQQSASGIPYSTYGSIDGGTGYDVLDLTNVGPVRGGVFQTGPDTYGTGIFVESQVFIVTNVEKILLGAQADDFMPDTNFGPSIEIRAGGGDDYIGIGGNWAVYGEAGDDTIFIASPYGQTATSGIIDGGSGVNTIDTYAPITLNLAAGTAVVGAASYTVSNIQNVVVGTSEGVASVTGDDAANAFSVQPFDDSGPSGVLFHGGGGDDVLTGSAVSDLLDGGSGADDMRGRGGDDIYVVDDVNDKVTELAGEGRDIIGTSLATFVLGVTAGSANVEDLVGLLDTGQTLTGSADANQIHGGAGDDVIDGGAGADTMTGGAGNDIYYVDNANDVVIENAGEGIDEVRTTLSTYALPANVEKLTYVGTGNFTFTGSGGNDNVGGNSGNDFFDLTQGGADKASGGGGTDAFSFGAAFGAGDSVDGGAGSDTVGIRGDYTGASKLTITAGQLVNVETLSIMTSLGGPVGYDISWSDGNLATNQRMAIYAGNLQTGENVTFDGSAETHGYFVMYGGLGTDTLKGGALSDGFYFGPGKFSQADHVDGGGGGQNQLGLDGSYDFSAGSALGTFGGNFTNIQTIVLYAGDPIYNIVTNDAAVAAGKLLTIFGTPVGSNLVFDGSAETDGAFKILSGTGDDTLSGGHGNDTLYGNLGADTLTGGAGSDVFLYTDAAQSTAAKTDHILDFDAGDKVDLSQIDADTTQAGDQAFSYIGASAFGHHAGELRADFANGVWTIQGDTDGDGAADFTLLVTTVNNHQMVNTDFVL